MLRPTGFTSARLVYRAPRFPDDEAHFDAWFADASVLLGTTPSVCRPRDGAAGAQWRKWNEEAAPGFAVMICLPLSAEEPTKPGEPVGWLDLSDVGRDGGVHRKGTFGLIISASYSGKGYATEAMEWLLEMAFVSYGLHRLEGNVFSWNTAAMRVYEKCGFVIEGRRRDAFWSEGSFHDDLVLGMLDHEYRARHPEKFDRLQK